MKYLIIFISIIFIMPVTAQTNIREALMDGELQKAFYLTQKKVETNPSDNQTLLRLQEMGVLFDTISNISGFTAASLTILRSPRTSAYAKYRASEAIMDYYTLAGPLQLAIPYSHSNGYITNWSILGPFTKTGAGDFNLPFTYETSFDSTKEYEVSGDTYAFKKIPKFTSTGEFAPFYGRNSSYTVCYLQSTISAPSNGTYYIHIQSTDPYKFWVKGKLIQTEKQVSTKYTPDNLIKLELNAGTYEISLKILRASSLPVFRMAFLNSQWKKVFQQQSKPAAGISFKAEPFDSPDLQMAKEQTEKQGSTAEDWFFLARKHLYDGRIDSFAKNMNKAIDLDKKNKFMKYMYSQVFVMGNEFSGSSRINKALSYLKEMNSSSSMGIQYLIAYNDMNNGRLRECTERLKNLSVVQKDSVLAHIITSRAYSELDWDNEFLPIALKGNTMAPAHRELNEILSSYYDQKGSKEGYEIRLKLITIRPYSLDNLLTARIFMFAGRYDDALWILNKIEERFPELAESKILKAEIASRLGQYEKMNSLLKDVTQGYEDNSYFLDTASRLQMQSGSKEKGLLNLESGLSADPGNIYLADKKEFYDTSKFYELREFLDQSKYPETLKTAFTTTEVSESGAIILSDEEILKMNTDGTWYKVVRQFVKITDKSGVERWASPTIPYFPKMKILKAATWLENGEQVDATEIKKQGESIVITFPIVRKGSVIELCYMIPGGGVNLARGTSWLSSDVNVFQTQDDPMKYVSYQIIAPKTMQVSIRKGSQNNSIKETFKTNHECKIWTYVANDMKPIKEETSMPSLLDVVPWVSVSTFPLENNLFKNWFDGIIDPALNPYPELDSKLFTLLDNRDLKNNTLHTIRKIYLWINNNVQGIQRDPYSIQESRKTLDLLSGTTMDKILLMKLFLARIGVSSDVLLMRTSVNHEMALAPLDTGYFTDSALKVTIAGKAYYLDMDNKYLAFGDISWEKYGSVAMNMTTGMTERMPLLARESSEHIIEYSNDVLIDEKAIIRMKGVRTFKGHYTIYQELFEEKEMLELTFNQIENQNLKGLGITNSHLTEFTGTNRRFDYSVEGISTAWINGSEVMKSIPFYGLRTYLFERYITDMSRKSPLKIYLPINTSQNINYHLVGWKVDNLPESINIKSEFGTYTATYSQQDEKTVTISVKTEIPLQTISLDKYQSFVNFCKQVDDAEQKEVLIKKQ